MKQRIVEFLKERGIYLTLMGCVLALGISTAVDKAKESEEPLPTAAPVSQSEDEQLYAVKTAIPAPVPSPSPSPTPAPVPDVTPDPKPEATSAPQREKANPPVKGVVQWRFAMDELIYSKTLNQWMTHSGIDISAKEGSEVHAVWGGTVEEVYKDDSLGVTVRISHSNGTSTLYANLKAEPPVKEGSKVSQGDVIGYIGDTAVAECSENSHLHFEVWDGKKAVDPEKYVLIIKE